MKKKRKRKMLCPCSLISFHFVDYAARNVRECVSVPGVGTGRERDEEREGERERGRKREGQRKGERVQKKNKGARSSLFIPLALSFQELLLQKKKKKKTRSVFLLSSSFQKLTPCARSRVWACRLCGCV